MIIVSAQGPNPSFWGGILFDLGDCWDKGLDSGLDQGLTIRIFSLGFGVTVKRYAMNNVAKQSYTTIKYATR